MLRLTILLIVHQLTIYGRTDAALGRSLDVSDLLPDDCGPINGKRNATQGPVYEFPWMAIIGYSTGDYSHYDCVGTIISSRYILTSADCAEPKFITSVLVGETNIRRIVNCQGLKQTFCQPHDNSYQTQEIGVSARIIHGDFNQQHGKSDNNIALLRLKSEINFDYPNVGTICLPYVDELSNSNVPGGVYPMGALVGWEYFHTRNTQGNVTPWPRSDVIRKIDFPMMSDTECHNQYWSGVHFRNLINSNEFCAGAPYADGCAGDNGAPLLVQGEYNCAVRYIQYGVVARGYYPCGNSAPIMFTDVRKHINWIIDNMRP